VSGDTSMTEQMESCGSLGIDYALFYADGTFNMGFKEAAKHAELFSAKHNMLMCLKLGVSYPSHFKK